MLFKTFKFGKLNRKTIPFKSLEVITSIKNVQVKNSVSKKLKI